MTKPLTNSEREQIDRCVQAAIEGTFFPDPEFHTLIGLFREKAENVFASRRLGQSKDYDFLTNNALVNLLGYPHRKPEELYARTMLERHQIRALLNRFREATSRSPAQSYLGGLE